VHYLNLDLTTILLQSELKKLTNNKFKTQFVFLRLNFFYRIDPRFLKLLGAYLGAFSVMFVMLKKRLKNYKFKLLVCAAASFPQVKYCFIYKHVCQKQQRNAGNTCRIWNVATVLISFLTRRHF